MSHLAPVATESSCTGDVSWGASRPPLRRRQHLAPGYQVVAHMRRGRRLDVYDVWSQERDCRCVAKTLRPERARDQEADAQLRTEGTLLATLTHPHLARAYETVESISEPRPVVILETLPGQTVAHLIDEVGRLPASDAAVLGVQLCSVLGYLHRQGWLHLDVKPANIVATGGRAVLLDLSLAAPPGAPASGGTLDYLAPEQGRGELVTAATDVWAVGATLFEGLSGIPPFEEWFRHQSAVRGSPYHPQCETRAPSLRRHRRCPRPLVDLVDACLEPRPADRPDLISLSAGLAAVAGINPVWGGP